MAPSSSWSNKIPPQILIAFLFFIVISAVNLFIGVMTLRNPAPFASSYWDIRWALIFAVAFFTIGLLAFFSQQKLLSVLTLTTGGILILLPLFTIGVGLAYLMLIIFVLIACGAGELVLRLLLGRKLPTGLERFVLSVLIGLGIIAALVAVQGMLFAFNVLVTWLGLSVLTLVFVVPNLKHRFFEWKRQIVDLHSLWSSEGHYHSGWALMLGLLGVLWVPSWFIALAPANRYDEMTYHIVAPLFYLSKGGILPYPEGGMTVWMHYAEMLYTLALQTAGQPLPRMLHLLMGLFSALLVFLFGRRLVNARVGMAAALLFVAAPVVGYETATAYIDLFVTAYTTAFGFSLLLAWQKHEPRWLLVAGVIGGLGLGTKLTAGPMIAALIAAFVIALLVGRRFKESLRWGVAMLALLLAVALPWLIRDFMWTGDPFYPYGGMFMDRIAASASASGTAAAAPGANNLVKILRYPLDLVFNSRLYYHEAPGGFASALPLLAIPLFLLFSSFSRRVKVTGLSLLAVVFATIAISKFANSLLLRYTLPTFPWLAVCAALNLEGVYTSLRNRNSKWGIAVLAMTLVVYVFSTRLPLITRIHDNLPQRFPLNYFLGRESTEDYLSRTLPVYDAFRFIDSQPNGPHRVLSIGNEFRLYTNSRIDGVYDVVEAHNMIATAESPVDLAHSIQAIGYDFILLNQPEVDFVKRKYADPYPVLQNSEFWNTYSELVYAKNGIYVYRFDPRGVQLSPAINLLQNYSFEEAGSANDLVDWNEFGMAMVSDQAYQGKHSVLLYAPLSPEGGGGIAQQVSIQENELYTVGYWLRADTTAVFLIRVNWLDENQQVILTEEQWKNVNDSWKWYSLSFYAPVKANFAEINVLLGNTNSAWVDDVCFAKGQRCPMAEGK